MRALTLIHPGDPRLLPFGEIIDQAKALGIDTAAHDFRLCHTQDTVLFATEAYLLKKIAAKVLAR